MTGSYSVQDATTMTPIDDIYDAVYSQVMGPELRHLRYLIAVAEHGNFTRAAEELRISQPTLSQQIKQMERVVGAQLLDRSGRTVRPTDAGEAYVYYAKRVLRTWRPPTAPCSTSRTSRGVISGSP